MELLKKFYNEKIVTWIYLLLPIVEIITSYIVVNVSISVTPGMIYKTLFILYGIVYLVFLDKTFRHKNCIILAIFAIVLIVHTFVTIESFSTGALVEKTSGLLKYACFPISLWFLYRYVQNRNKLNIKAIVIASIIYGGTMVLAWITGTYMPTYDSRPNAGHSGWIYSGNELSSILAMFYPIIIYYTASYKNKLGVMALLLLTYGLLAVGTKTAFLALIISIIAFSVYGIISCKKEIGKNLLFITSSLVIVIMAVVTYFPTLTEISDRIRIARETVNTTIPTEEQAPMDVVDNLVFNGRENFLSEQKEKSDEADIMQKMFGLNSANKLANEYNEYKLIERDFHDLIITYGIIPSIIYIIPLAIVLSKFALIFFRNIKKEFNIFNFSLGVSTVMMFGIAYIVGHVLLVPVVAIFFSFILAKLYDKDEINI